MSTLRDTDPRPRGRPRGTLKLTAHDRVLLLAAIESGATDHTAAKAAGIDPRTFRTYRQIAEGRHPTRPPTRALVALFREIDEASARARIRREMSVADKDPRHWLRYRAPSEPGLPGWTERVPDDQASDSPALYQPTPEDLTETFRVLVESGAIPNPFAKKEEPDGDSTS